MSSEHGVPLVVESLSLVEQQVGAGGVDGRAAAWQLAAGTVVVAQPRARRVARVGHVVTAAHLPGVRLRGKHDR